MQLLFKLVHLIIGPLPVVLRAEPLQALHHYPAVPASVKNGDVPIFGQAGPEAPQIVPGLFVGLGAGHWVDLEAPGVQRPGQALDVAALPGRVPALVHDDHRHPLAVQPVVEHPQLLLQLFQLLLIFLFRQGFARQGRLGQLGHLNQRKGVLQQGHRQASVVQGGVNACAENLHSLQLGKLFRLGVNDIPGRAGRVGVVQIFVKHLLAAVVMLVLPNISPADPPGGVLVPGESGDAGGLLLFADVEKEFQHQIAVVRQLALKTADAVHPLGVLLVVQHAVQAFLGNLVHPAGIQEGELPGFGDFLEMPGQKGLAALLLRGGGHGENLEKAGVDAADDLADGAALSGGAPALN